MNLKMWHTWKSTWWWRSSEGTATNGWLDIRKNKQNWKIWKHANKEWIAIYAFIFTFPPVEQLNIRSTDSEQEGLHAAPISAVNSASFRSTLNYTV